MPKAFITGITGQDGAYLTQLLLDQGYAVVGTSRDPLASPDSALAVLGLLDEVKIVQADLMDVNPIISLLQEEAPDEVYHLASQSSIGRSFQAPLQTGEINGLGTARLLEAVRLAAPQARFVLASSADIFGHPRDFPQNEQTRICPVSPYGAGKAYAHFLTGVYRESYGLHASSAIMYNHESPFRPPHFVSRKITMGAARIKLGLQQELALGNLEIRRDWGFAGDYMHALSAMAQQVAPDDYIIATGKCHALKEFVKLAFAAVDLDYEDYVRVDSQFIRPVDEEALVGDPSKAKQQLKWQATVTFPQLVESMVLADLKALTAEVEL
jgi:GDPmannose 4,6-dehydratase